MDDDEVSWLFYKCYPMLMQGETIAEPIQPIASLLRNTLYKPILPRVSIFQQLEKIVKPSQRNALFQSVCMLEGEPFTLIMDSGSTKNLVATYMVKPCQRNALFQSVCMVEDQPCTLIIDSGSSKNLVATDMVARLGLKRSKHPTPYPISWVQGGYQLFVEEQCTVEFRINEYKDKIICDIVSMDACDTRQAMAV